MIKCLLEGLQVSLCGHIVTLKETVGLLGHLIAGEFITLELIKGLVPQYLELVRTGMAGWYGVIRGAFVGCLPGRSVSRHTSS